MFALTSIQDPQAAAPSPTTYVPPQPHGMLDYFAATGFIGPVLLLLGAAAAVLAIRRWLELLPSAMAPQDVQRLLEGSVRQGQLDQAFAQASASRTTLGELVAAGLLMRSSGLDDMLANTERAAIKESLYRQARVVMLSRLGTTILLVAVAGTVSCLMSMMATLSRLKMPLISDFTTGIGESLAATVMGLVFAAVCYWVYGLLSARAVTRLLDVRTTAEELLVEAARPRS